VVSTYTPANTTVTILRGTSFDPEGDVEDVTAQIATGVLCQINAARNGTYGVRVFEPGTTEPSTIRTFEGVMPSGTGVENTDRLVDEKSGNVFEVIAVIDPLYEYLQPDLQLVLKRVTATTQVLCRRGKDTRLIRKGSTVARVVISAKAIVGIEVATHEFLDHVIGPLVTADAIRYAPERTGVLKSSIRYWVVGQTLYVGAFAPYAADVELGHRVYHRFKHQLGPEVVPEEPYLRPALYKYRTPADLDPPATFPVAVEHPVLPFTFESLRAYFANPKGQIHSISTRTPLRMPL
jgi:hypothetical protein